MIELKQIKALIKLMVDNNLTEVDLQDEQGERVKLKRGGDGGVQYVTPSAPIAPVPIAAAEPSATPTAEPSADDGLVPIKSIMVGTFYSASSPDVPPFVQVGDNIGPESVICLIEAMKVFNEVKAEISGSIEKVCVESGQAVEHDQVLFLVRPS